MTVFSDLVSFETYNRFNSNVTLPYIHGLFEQLRNSLKKFINNAYCENTNTLGNYLIMKKDGDPIGILSGVMIIMNLIELSIFMNKFRNISVTQHTEILKINKIDQSAIK